VTSPATIARSAAAPGTQHYPIVDALRFLLAMWVVMAHFGEPPLFAGADSSNRVVWLFMHGWSTIVYGLPAVIGFFVISGFCIHLPFRHGEKLPVGRYYARRYIRILIPVIAALAINRLAGSRDPIFGRNTVLWTSVLWSLLCEEIYYAVYPGMRLLRKRFGWPVLLSASFLSAVVAVIHYGKASSWTDVGPLQTALVLYPIWLLGCVLAEQSDKLPAIDSATTIWIWRFLAWAGSWVCEMLNFHFGVPYTQTLPWYGILAFLWIRKEIAYGRHNQPSALLISGGAWSYSLYLFHEPAMRILWNLSLPNLGYMLNWFVSFVFMLGLSYAFYLAVERPSHRLARMFRTTTRGEPQSSKSVVAVPEPELAPRIRGN
jgi:peptidoglycan/LPS O-acetylase OafA/YrhL